MKRAIAVAVLNLGFLPMAVHAANLTCKGEGPCVCTESVDPKSMIGYDPTPDMGSINVNVTCINMHTMEVSYYTVRREDAMGAYNGVGIGE